MCRYVSITALLKEMKYFNKSHSSPSNVSIVVRFYYIIRYSIFRTTQHYKDRNSSIVMFLFLPTIPVQFISVKCYEGRAEAHDVYWGLMSRV